MWQLAKDEVTKCDGDPIKEIKKCRADTTSMTSIVTTELALKNDTPKPTSIYVSHLVQNGARIGILLNKFYLLPLKYSSFILFACLQYKTAQILI